MLEYQRPGSQQTLAAGLREYFASREGLVGGRGVSPAAREFFRCHDAAHVVFGCTTSLVDEAIVKIWSAFGTTAGTSLWRAYRLPESQEVYERLAWGEMAATALRSLTIVPRVLWRCLRMRKRWPWSDFDAYLDVPLAEIRREHGIRPLVIGPARWLAPGWAAALWMFLVWAASPWLFAVAEPWDTAYPFYTLAALLGGALLGLRFRAPIPAFLGAWAGQVLALLVLPGHDRSWLMLGVATTAIGSLLVLASAVVGALLRGRAAAGLAVLLGVSALACLPTYSIYRYDSGTAEPHLAESIAIESRLASLLEAEGYRRFQYEAEVSHTDVVGCSEPSDLITWRKELAGRSSAWLAQVRCAGRPRFQIRARLPSARKAEGERLRRLLDREFADELARGALLLRIDWQFDLE